MRLYTETELRDLRERLNREMSEIDGTIDPHNYRGEHLDKRAQNETLILNILEARRLLGKLLTGARREMYFADR